MEHVTSGGDDNSDDLARTVGAAYGCGWAEGIAYARQQLLAGPAATNIMLAEA